MKAIYKQTLLLKEKQSVSLRNGWKIIRVGTQQGVPTIWYSFPHADDLAREIGEEVTFYLIATGQEYDETALIYHGTSVGPFFVWHVFSEASQNG